MNEYKLLLLPGDGIGPEVLDATMRVVGWYGQKGLPYQTETALLGGAAIDRFALVVPSALARSQMRRQISRLDCQFFTEREPAIQWLGWTERMPIDCPA